MRQTASKDLALKSWNQLQFNFSNLNSQPVNVVKALLLLSLAAFLITGENKYIDFPQSFSQVQDSCHAFGGVEESF